MSDPVADTGSPRPLGRNDSAGSGSSAFRTPRRKRPLAQHDTPMAHTINGTQRSFDDSKSEKMYKRYAEESKRWIVGPMPVEDFLREFLPQVDEEMPSAKDAFKKVPSNPTSEREIYGPLLEDINTANRCPDIRFFDTSSASVDSGIGSRKPDCCGYHENELKNIREKNGKRPADLGHAELFFEIKMDNDPFDDPPHNLRDEDRIKQHSFININTEARKLAKNALGQNVAYAVEACARQHRAFYFSVFIVKTRARLIRWDRSGAIVSRSFDYKRNPRYLCEFLWRFGLATPERQGYDPTVIPGTRDDEDIFYKEISSRVAFELNLDPDNDVDRLAAEVGRHYQPGRVTKLAVPEGTTIQYYLVSRPVRSPLSMAGRSTRGYWSVKIDPSGKEHAVVFVKDTWRVDVSRIEVEGEIYDDLIKEGVVNISGVLHHSEVPSQLGAAIQESLTGEDQGKNADDENIPEPDESGDGNEAETDEAPSRVDVPLQTLPMDKDQGWGASETVGPSGINEDNTSDNQNRTQVQCTRTNEFFEATWSCRGGRNMKVTKHVHYRLVLAEVGYPLTELSGTRELFEATRDALKALIEAHDKCKRLHRDVSVDNIILVRDKKTGRRRGILIDWELSTKTDRQGKARDYFRSGTWAFMSRAACAGDEGFRHSLDDDMESLIYVILFCCARFIPHGYVANLGRKMGRLFDSYDEEGNIMTGGEVKDYELYKGNFTGKLQLRIEIWAFFASAYRSLSFISGSLVTEQQRLWKPEVVLDLWENICNAGLHDGDRYVHDVGDVLGERSSYHAPRTTTITGELMTGELSGSYGSGSRKRSPGGEGEDSKQTSKRRRGNNGRAKHIIDSGANGQRRSGSKHQKGRRRTVSMPGGGRDGRRSARLATKASSKSLR